MSNKSQKFLLVGVVAAIKANESVERAFTLAAAKSLALVIDEHDASDVRSAWRKLNIETYRKAGLVKGDALYGQLSKFSSMLLKVGLEREDVLEQYVAGEWQSLQGVYAALSGKKAKKAATQKPRTFAQRAQSFVASATPRQRAWLVKNLRKLVAAA